MKVTALFGYFGESADDYPTINVDYRTRKVVCRFFEKPVCIPAKLFLTWVTPAFPKICILIRDDPASRYGVSPFRRVSERNTRQFFFILIRKSNNLFPNL